MGKFAKELPVSELSEFNRWTRALKIDDMRPCSYI